MEDPPHHRVHLSVTIGLLSNVDRDGLLWVCLAITSSDTEIVGAVMDIAGHHHRFFFIPFPILGVGDVDGVVMATVRVVDNEADRCVVSIILGFVGDPIEVNTTEGDAECIVLWEWGGTDGKLWGWSGCAGRGVFWWGEK